MTTTFAPHTPVVPERVPTELTSRPTTAPVGLQLQLWRPTSTSVVVHVAGELDATTAPRLHELLAPRLSSTVEAVILDFSELRFMGVAGLELLARARRRAATRAMALSVVDGPICVERALRAAGWNDTVPAHRTLAAAVAELTGPPRESVPHALE